MTWQLSLKASFSPTAWPKPYFTTSVDCRPHHTILGGSKSPTMHEIRIRKIFEYSIKRCSVQAFFEWVHLISTVFENFFVNILLPSGVILKHFVFLIIIKSFIDSNCAKALSRNKQKALDAKYNILTCDHVPILLCWNLRLVSKSGDIEKWELLNKP